MSTSVRRAVLAAGCLVLLVAALALVSAPTGAPLPASGAANRADASPAVAGTRHGRLHPPSDDVVETQLRLDGDIGTDATTDEIARAVRAWRADVASASDDWWDASDTARLADIERQALLAQAPSAKPITAHVLVIPVEFAGVEELTYEAQNPSGQCVSMTGSFTGPLHGAIPYPGGSVTETIDNQTVYYARTEPEDYAKLIFGRDGYTEPVRKGDPNVNGGEGVDISGLTVQSYFDAQSDGTVTITGTVASWVQDPHSEAFYGLDQCVSNMPARALPDDQLGQLGDLAVTAAQALKARGGVFATYAFWKQFDADDDGEIDAFWLIHAGRGQEYGGGTEGEAAIWSRANHVGSYDGYDAEGYVIHDNGTPDPTDDVRIGGFEELPEDSDIGVFIEEFGHGFFELPDLYTNDASNSAGWWAPMSAGIWGGELAGTRPVNMPLWFRMVAECGGEPCGWADPVKAVTYTAPSEVVVLGEAGTPAGGTVPSGPYAGRTIHEGLRIDLPEQTEVVPNRTGEGGGAYSGAEIGQPFVLERDLDLSSATAPITLTFDAFWNIRAHAGFGHVMVATDGVDYVTLPDMDGRTTSENRYGINRGNGITGQGEGKLRYDLSAYAGRVIQLAILYQDWLGPSEGWWIDNVSVSGVFEDDFEDGLGAWANTGWSHVPMTLRFPQYYLVEWRNSNGFDASLLDAYVTNFHDDDEWRVDRVAANVPGAVVWYRNMKYDGSSSLLSAEYDPPSIGPKYRLLVVDTNYWPTSRPSGRPYPSSLESLDGALAFGTQSDATLELRDAATKALVGTETITGTTGVTRFLDSRGYVPGFRLDPGAAIATPAPVDRDGSAVVPSLNGEIYSTRITGPGRSRPHPLDGRPVGIGDHYFGSGDPADANLQLGVRIELVDQAPDGSWGAVRFYNAALDYELSSRQERWMPGSVLTVTAQVASRASVTATVRRSVLVRFPGETEYVSSTTRSGAVAPGETSDEDVPVVVPPSFPMDPTGELPLHVRALFDDGHDVWAREVVFDPPSRIFLPTAKRE